MNRYVFAAAALGSIVVVGGIACSAGGSEEPVGKALQRVIPGPDGGWVVECNGYQDGGPYNYCTWNCHDAANCGVNAGNDGIIACEGQPNGDIGGHTVNWDTVPCADKTNATCTAYCVSEPQLPGSAACCWEQPGGGPINIGSGDGNACANKLCDKDGGTTPVALDAGETWDASTLDCKRLGNKGDCAACCDSNHATQISWCSSLSGQEKTDCEKQVNDFYASCKSGCDALATADAATPVPADASVAPPQELEDTFIDEASADKANLGDLAAP